MKKPNSLSTAFATYAVNQVIGEGGSGVVYGATDDVGAEFAVKVLNPERASREKLKRFENEYRFCSRNKHPNIVTVLDHGLSPDGAAFFVMPRYEGSLRSLIGHINPTTVLDLFSKVLDGVEAAHKLNVVHRDLKPENILHRKNGLELVVADFGIARFEEDELFTAVETKDGTRLANFQYAAPEQRIRGRSVDARADIYALGLILNELYTGELAHGTGFKAIASVSADFEYLDGIVDAMLRQNPATRFSDIDSVKKELIARGCEHISRQKLSALEKVVLPVSAVDDPLVTDPIRLVGGDWDNNVLSLTLSQEPNSNWVWAFRNMGSHTAVMGKGPDTFQFRGKQATISAEPRECQQIIGYFKDWLPQANRVYAEKIKQSQEQAEREERDELQRRVKQEKTRAQVLRELKF
jgi:serine/threonine protein kinase